jgi:hypothetical protein
MRRARVVHKTLDSFGIERDPANVLDSIHIESWG